MFSKLVNPSSQDAGTGFRRALLSVLDQGICSFTNFLTLVILGRACHPEGVGLYHLAASITIVVTTFQIAVISYPQTVYSARLKGEALRAYLGSTLVHKLAIGIFALVVLGAVRLVVSSGVIPIDVAPVLATLQWALLPILLRDFCRRVLFARFLFGVACVFDGVLALLQIAGLLLLAQRGSLSPQQAFWVLGATAAAVSAALLVWDRHAYRYSRQDFIPAFRKNWRIGKWLTASRVMAMLGPLVYPWLLALFHSAAETGLFAVYMGLCALLNPALHAIGNLIGPQAAKAQVSGGPEQVREVVGRACLLTLALTLGSTLVLGLFGATLAGNLFGEEYRLQRLTIISFCLVHLLWALPLPIEAGLNSLERSEVITKSYAIGAVVTLIVGLSLVSRFAIEGAIASLLVVNLTTAAYRFRKFWTLTAVPKVVVREGAPP